METKAIKTPTNTAAMTEKAAAPVAKKQTAGAIDYLNSASFRSQLQMALPKFFDTDRFVRSAISDFRLNPALQECSVPSVLGFYMQAAMCGLEPSSVLGQCYPVPFNNHKTGLKECQFIIGYRGMASIARRSGEVLSIDAKIVHEKDTFDLVYGLESNITHIPYLEGDPGAMIGAYCIVKFKDSSHQFEYMPKYKIDQHRSRSKGSKYGPWVTDYEEMAKKTVFRSIFKWLPVSIEAAAVEAERADSNVVNYNPSTKADAAPDDVIEIDFVAAAPEESD